MRYEIHIDNDGDGRPDVTYRFEFTTEITNPNSFLYNTGPIDSLDSKDWNRRQFYSLTRVADGREHRLAHKLPCPPCNVGPLSTPKYAELVRQATYSLSTGSGSSPGSARTAFSSTWVRFSTSALCGRSSSCTWLARRSSRPRGSRSTPPTG